MPPLRPPTPSEDSESDAPETISLTQSKNSIRKQNADIRKVEATVREKARLKNREKDKKLKERAAFRKGRNEKGFVIGLDGGKGKEKRREDQDEESEDEDGVMLHAINDAGDEGREGAGDSEEGGDSKDESSFDSSGMNEDETGHQGQDDEDEEMSADEVDLASANQPPGPKSNSNNYLPDELFQAAFSQQANKPKKNDSEYNKKVVTKNDKRRKKASSTSKPKDILVGSRTIRTFQSSKSQPVPSTSNPSAKVNKFLDRALGLKSQKKALRRKGWERRPANIGILRRNGPAAHFVRNQ